MAEGSVARKILIPIDNSTYCEDAFDWYASNMHKPDNELVLVHCHEMSAPTMPSRDHNDYKAALEDHSKKVIGLMEKYKAKLEEAKIGGRIKAEHGKPGEVLVKAADAENVDAIIMGSRGLGMIRRTVLGSVSDYVLKHANCPVMICPKRKSGRKDSLVTDRKGSVAY